MEIVDFLLIHSESFKAYFYKTRYVAPMILKET